MYMGIIHNHFADVNKMVIVQIDRAGCSFCRDWRGELEWEKHHPGKHICYTYYFFDE